MGSTGGSSCLAAMASLMPPPVTFRAGIAKTGLLTRAKRKVMKMSIWARRVLRLDRIFDKRLDIRVLIKFICSKF